jgi:hypothetical protein
LLFPLQWSNTVEVIKVIGELTCPPEAVVIRTKSIGMSRILLTCPGQLVKCHGMFLHLHAGVYNYDVIVTDMSSFSYSLCMNVFMTSVT